MISRKSSKKKTKSKKVTKRYTIKKYKRNPEIEPLDNLLELLDKRSAKALYSKTGTSHHYDGIIKNIEIDIEYGGLKQNSSKVEILKYLRDKKEIIEGVIMDFVRLE